MTAARSFRFVFEKTKVVVSKDAPGFDAASNCGGVGASVSVSGVVVASKGKGQEVEIKADEVEVGQVSYGVNKGYTSFMRQYCKGYTSFMRQYKTRIRYQSTRDRGINVKHSLQT